MENTTEDTITGHLDVHERGRHGAAGDHLGGAQEGRRQYRTHLWAAPRDAQGQDRLDPG